MCMGRRFFVATFVVAFAPKHHHTNAHEWTQEERQKWQDHIGIDLPHPNEQPDDTGNAEQNVEYFTIAAPHKEGGGEIREYQREPNREQWDQTCSLERS